MVCKLSSRSNIAALKTMCISYQHSCFYVDCYLLDSQKHHEMEKHHNVFHIALQLHNLQFDDLLKNMGESLKVELLKLFFHSKVYQ